MLFLTSNLLFPSKCGDILQWIAIKMWGKIYVELLFHRVESPWFDEKCCVRIRTFFFLATCVDLLASLENLDRFANGSTNLALMKSLLKYFITWWNHCWNLHWFFRGSGDFMIFFLHCPLCSMSILLEQWNVLVWLCGLSWRSVVRRNARQTTLGRGGKESGGNGVCGWANDL